MALPLDGISVIEFGQNLAGPFCAEILAHLGADVVKVERPGAGDDARELGTAVRARHVRRVSLDEREQAQHRGRPEGRRRELARLRALVGRADVLVQNMRPGAMDELGLGADALRAEFPRLDLLLALGVRPHRARGACSRATSRWSRRSRA